ncbi:hypothetical protein [Tardiphaga alba]|nr:hypothetical protein [Tardiphaga alba]
MQAASHALPDHRFNEFREEAAAVCRIVYIPGALQVFPSDLDSVLHNE